MPNPLYQDPPNILSVDEFPAVSIGLPTYNGAERIATCLKSIVSQEYPNLEVIISDNCSTDQTEAVCKSLCATHSNLYYFRQEENLGPIPNFEFVLGKARSPLFMWISDDDTLEPGILKKCVDFLTRNPDYSLVSGQIQYWSDHHRVFVERDLGAEKNSRGARVIGYYRNVVHGAAFYGLMWTEAAQKVCIKNRIGEDWHFVAKAAFQGKIKMLDTVGYHKKLNGTSRTFRHYARVIGASWFSATFPHVRIALDAFLDLLTSPEYERLSVPAKFMLAIRSCASVLINHYRRYPYIVGGKILRLLGFKKLQRITPEDTIEEKWAW